MRTNPAQEAHRRILLRVEGTASRGGSGQALQKAKVGYCPCCSIITHIAVPPTYDAGDYVEAKCTGTSLWQQSGPWAPRYLAAHQYRNSYGKLSSHWDWAAYTLDLTAPPPLSLSKLQEKSTDCDAPQNPLHVKPTPPSPSLHVQPPSSDRPKDVTPSPMQVNLSSCIPDVKSITRDLSRFLVDDLSPTSTGGPRCSDGRDLSAIRRQNFPRGGHRLEPASSSSKDGGSSQSKPAPAYAFGSGKPSALPVSSSHETSPPCEHGTTVYGKAKSGKTKSDFYSPYLEGKGKSAFKGHGKRNTAWDHSPPEEYYAAPYGKSK